MKVDAIHSFLVHPDKAADKQTTIRGTAVTGKSRLVEMLTGVFHAAPHECKHDIHFVHDESGDQQNVCRDLVIAYRDSASKANGLKIAQRLQKVTTHRSGLGLFFLVRGSKGSQKRVMLSRFPADHGILANEEGHSLTVEFVERVFMKSATAYKSAVYEGTNDASFWVGRAIDKQINDTLTLANYWIRDFLMSEFSLTGAAGTRRFAINLRNAIAAVDDVAVKQELASLARLAINLEGKVKSPFQIAGDFSISPAAVGAMRQQFPSDKLFEETFTFTKAEFVDHIAFRSIELDTSVLLTAPTETFEQLIKQEPAAGTNQVRFTTVGKVVDEKLRKSK